MADIFEEALNDSRDEKQFAIFSKIFPIIIIITVVLAVAITAYNWHSNNIISHNQKISDSFTEIVKSETLGLKSANESLEKISKVSENKISGLAQIKIAQNLIVNNQENLALKKLEEIMTKDGFDEVTKSFAKISWIGIVIDKKDLSDELKNKLHEYFNYFSDENQPFFANATLMKALFFKKSSENEKASQYANTILKLENVPIIIKEQAMAVLSYI